jgi:hypothetical protein
VNDDCLRVIHQRHGRAGGTVPRGASQGSVRSALFLNHGKLLVWRGCVGDTTVRVDNGSQGALQARAADVSWGYERSNDAV